MRRNLALGVVLSRMTRRLRGETRRFAQLRCSIVVIVLRQELATECQLAAGIATIGFIWSWLAGLRGAVRPVEVGGQFRVRAGEGAGGQDVAAQLVGQPGRGVTEFASRVPAVCRVLDGVVVGGRAVRLLDDAECGLGGGALVEGCFGRGAGDDRVFGPVRGDEEDGDAAAYDDGRAAEDVRVRRPAACQPGALRARLVGQVAQFPARDEVVVAEADGAPEGAGFDEFGDRGDVVVEAPVAVDER